MNEKIIICPQLTLQLKEYRRLSKVSPLALLKKYRKELRGLSLRELDSWLNPMMFDQYADTQLLDKVMIAWKSEIMALQARTPTGERVEITNEYLAQIRSEIQRTDVNPTKFYRLFHSEIPALEKNSLGVWLRGRQQKSHKEILDQVLKKYQSLPKAFYKVTLPKGYYSQRIECPIKKEDLDLLQLYRDKLNLLPGHIFKISSDIPIDLDNHKVSRILNGYSKTANPDHIKWLKKRCREVMEDFSREFKKHEKED